MNTKRVKVQKGGKDGNSFEIIITLRQPLGNANKVAVSLSEIELNQLKDDIDQLIGKGVNN